MKIKAQTSIIVSILIVLAGIMLTVSQGLWTTESTKIPEKLKQVEYSEQYDPSDIRGSYTFSEISKLFNIPIEDLAVAFQVDRNEAQAFKCKDLEVVFADAPNEIGTGSVRMFVAFYKGLPYESEEETYLTDSAANLLKEVSNMNAEQLLYLEDHTFSFTK